MTERFKSSLTHAQIISLPLTDALINRH